MKLQFKHQKFQADAAKAVCDVFAGQLRNGTFWRSSLVGVFVGGRASGFEPVDLGEEYPLTQRFER